MVEWDRVELATVFAILDYLVALSFGAAAAAALRRAAVAPAGC